MSEYIHPKIRKGDMIKDKSGNRYIIESCSESGFVAVQLMGSDRKTVTADEVEQEYDHMKLITGTESDTRP